MKHLWAACLLPLAFFSCKNATPTVESITESTAISIEFNADSASHTLQAQCAFGERTPGSTAHERCGDYIAAQFRRYGLSVEEQTAPATMWDGKQFTLRNIMARYNPDATERIILAAHWDSRPWADADKDSANHRLPVMAANDGASGVSVMLEVARLIQQLNPKVGVDFICFDLEDYGAPYWGTAPDDDTDWCVGSRYWANHIPWENYAPRYGVLLDMVGGKDARFHFEGHSMRYASHIVAKLWAAARTAGAARYFVEEDGSFITDDHVPMNEIARIPTIDIIPYSNTGFPDTWHTRKDIPENISKETLKAVGQTLLQALAEEE